MYTLDVYLNYLGSSFQKITFFSLLLLLGISSCKTTQPVRPDEVYKEAAAMPPSSILLPLSIGLDDLEKTINSQIDLLFKDASMLSNDYGEGVKIDFQKSGPISLSAKGSLIQFNLPLDLQIEKDIGITTAKADASLVLNFETDYAIDENWNIKTETIIAGYDWTKKPVINLGFIKLPVEPLANQLIDRSKAVLTREIDKQLQDRFALKEFAQLAIDTLQQAFLVSPEYDAWLSVRPKLVAMSPLETVDRKIKTTILLEALTEISVGGKSDVSQPITTLPPLEIKKIEGEGFQFYFQTSVPYSVIEAEAKKEMLGAVFEDGKRKVKIEDLKVFGQGDKMVVNALLSGSYEGNIYLLGKPVYNEAKGQLELEDLDFELKTRQFLKKSMAWLLQRNLKKQLQESLVYPVKKELEETKVAMQEEMKGMLRHPQLEIDARLGELTIRQLFVEKEALVVSLVAKGEMRADVEGLYFEEE